MKEIEEVLLERQKTHGKFKDHAKLAQHFKFILRGGLMGELTDVQQESLEMILHKVARIANGAGNYEDHWIDIIGYAQLAVNELRGIEV